MKPFPSLLSFSEALSIVEANIKPLTRTEIVGIDEASGRVLAETVVAGLSVPSFDRAAMDGYAVIAGDTIGSSRQNPKILNKLAGELHAGETLETSIKTVECFQIATGAMVPLGADAVVPVEDTEATNGMVKVFKPVPHGANISQKGEDIKEGETILKHGIVLDAGKIGVLASQGLTNVEVYAKPGVAILSSGEEVSELGGKLKQGSIYDVNSHTIAAVVRENGGIPHISGVVHDNPAEIKTKIAEALDNDAVVISGGSSVGERDLLVDALHGWGKILFHGIQVKPGKPTLFAKVQGKPLFGMPGPPTSCLMQSLLFLAPAVRKMAHLPPKAERKITLKLACRVHGLVDRKQFLNVRVEGDEAVPVFKKSGAITSVAGTDGYIEIPADIEFIEKGTAVTVTLF